MIEARALGTGELEGSLVWPRGREGDTPVRGILSGQGGPPHWHRTQMPSSAGGQGRFPVLAPLGWAQHWSWASQ